MSDVMRQYESWSSVPLGDAHDQLLLSASRGRADLEIDLTDGHEPDLLIDLDAEASVDETDGRADEGYLSMLPSEWSKLAKASHALLSSKAAAKADAGSVPLGMHVDLRG